MNDRVRPAVVLIGAAAAYVSILAWKHQSHVHEWWQIGGVIAVLAALAVWTGRHKQIWSSAAAATVALSACFSIDSATYKSNDGLWPVGAVLVAGATLLGFALIATLASALSRWRRKGSA